MAYYKNSVGPTIKFQNTFNAFNKGSGYGAAAGSQFGGWGALIGAAIGGTVGTLGSYFNNKEAYKQGKKQLKMAKIANSATLTQVGRNLNEINRQRTILSMETQSALLYAQAQGRAQNASLANVYAAADQVGNQQLYQHSAVQNVVDEQQYQSLFNLQTQQLNLNVQVQNLINASKDKFVGVNVQGGQFSIGQALNDIIGSAMAMAGNANFGGSSGGASMDTSGLSMAPTAASTTMQGGATSVFNAPTSSVFTDANISTAFDDQFWTGKFGSPLNQPSAWTASARLGLN